MTGLFLKLLNMSIAASWLILAVVLLRAVFKKAPKWICCLLWAVVALRLLLPFSPESAVSLIPSAEVIPQDIAASQTPAIHSGIPVVNSAINPLFAAYIVPGDGMLEIIVQTASAVWLLGALLLMFYNAASYLRLRWRMRMAVLLRENVYACDGVSSPFILGMLRPRIYVPLGMDDEQMVHVLAHENAHIQRRDHWWKPLGFLLLAVYWFNPLLWLAYAMLCRDIEQACDEKVIAGMNVADKKRYSHALLACSVRRRTILTCPLAFGEVDVKVRIKSVLSYKKPTFWIILASVTACVVMAVCFLTNPIPCTHAYTSQITQSATCTETGVQTRICQLCKHSYTVTVTLLEHSYDEGTVITAPTCTRPGTMEHACVDCGARKRERIEPSGHTDGAQIVTKEPNCTETGVLSTTCTVCHAEYVVQVLQINDVHQMRDEVLVESTCKKPGEGIQTCTLCGHTESCSYPLAEHTYKHFRTDKPTCSHQGEYIEVCTQCGEVRITKLPRDPDAHSWSSSYTVYGEKSRDKCGYCGKIICYETTPVDSYDLVTGVTYQTTPQWPVFIWDVSQTMRPTP